MEIEQKTKIGPHIIEGLKNDEYEIVTVDGQFANNKTFEEVVDIIEDMLDFERGRNCI